MLTGPLSLYPELKYIRHGLILIFRSDLRIARKHRFFGDNNAADPSLKICEVALGGDFLVSVWERKLKAVFEQVAKGGTFVSGD